MSILSDRINNLSESATLKMTKLGRELAAKGVNVISLSVGEPDFNTPDHVKEAAKKHWTKIILVTHQYRAIQICAKLL